ncbi:MAG: sodium/solute symporter [Candidatus Latescibacteria bacterium]|nr:sodium/solute symporter [Candidatus Latescibacterota bacterium]
MIDSIVVATYFLIVFIAGYFVSRHYSQSTDHEFITGGRTRKWYQVSVALFAMAADPSVMGVAGLGFLWGLYLIQWPGVHMWFTTWFAAMFLVPIYWRSRIVTTPEYLEKRFNVQCRAFFSLILISILIVTLAGAMYLGALLLKNLLGWSMIASIILISSVVGFYVILGGMKTVLSIDFYQGLLIIITLVVVSGMALYKIGGFAGFAASMVNGNAGVNLNSIIPPSDWSIFTDKYFPMQAVIVWATIAGVGWMSCNFSMAQRLLAAKTEKDAQKALLFLAILVIFYPFVSFMVGAIMRIKMPGILPDEAIMKIILEMFPAGVRGFLVAGLMAALLSSVDGMLTASSALFSEDIYQRILRPTAKSSELKKVTRIVEALTILMTISLFPLVVKSQSAMAFIQSFYGDVLGVVVALYVLGVFTTRVSPWSAFIAMISGVAVSVSLDIFTEINFTYIGFFSFVYTVISAMILCRFEKPLPVEKLTNLTVFTLPDVKGPWVGLKSWPALWKWALFLASIWFVFSAVWEYFVTR